MRLINTQVFTSSGTYKPSPGLVKIVFCLGKGGTGMGLPRPSKSPLTTIAPLPSSARLGKSWEGN